MISISKSKYKQIFEGSCPCVFTTMYIEIVKERLTFWSDKQRRAMIEYKHVPLSVTCSGWLIAVSLQWNQLNKVYNELIISLSRDRSSRSEHRTDSRSEDIGTKNSQYLLSIDKYTLSSITRSQAKSIELSSAFSIFTLLATFHLESTISFPLQVS